MSGPSNALGWGGDPVSGVSAALNLRVLSRYLGLDAILDQTGWVTEKGSALRHMVYILNIIIGMKAPGFQEVSL